ncbi:MAG TPA: hypothetical protein VJN96_10055 [Vicinamibacterales bacterium]|nr:hypothetical protein [Vicinamibacterales bacterium]
MSSRKVGGGRSGPAPAAKCGKSRIRGGHPAHDRGGKPWRRRGLPFAGGLDRAIQGVIGVLVVPVRLVG